MRLNEDSFALAKELYYKIIASATDNDTDLVTNEDGRLWIKDISGSWREENRVFDTDLIETLGFFLAENYGYHLNVMRPYIDCSSPFDGARINIVTKPVKALPTIAVRFHKEQFRGLDALIRTGMIGKEDADLLKRHVLDKRTIIISGGMGSGKTTLLSALANEIPKHERVLVIEDTRELNIGIPNVDYMLTGSTFTGEDAIHNILRETPDRIIYGEVRGAEAVQLLKAWNTGHRGGLGTIHANSVDDIRIRLDDCCKESNNANMTRTIDAVLDIGVQIERRADGSRYIAEIRDFRKSHP